MSDSLDKARGQFIKTLEKRRAELQPHIDEANEIDQQLGELGTSKPKRTASRSKRQRRGENRADQFVKLVEKNPGTTVAEAAKEMGIQPNYLYRVSAEAVEAGRVAKKDRQYFPATKASAETTETADSEEAEKKPLIPSGV